jgi:hypothetical protein
MFVLEMVCGVVGMCTFQLFTSADWMGSGFEYWRFERTTKCLEQAARVVCSEITKHHCLDQRLELQRDLWNLAKT